MNFVANHEISTFEELSAFTKEHEKKYQGIVREQIANTKRLTALTELVELYEAFVPYREVKNSSQGLKGLSKMRYDKEHKCELEQYQITREALYAKLKEGEKPTPIAWSREITDLKTKLKASHPKYSKELTEIACAEVIAFNKGNYEREQSNEESRNKRNLQPRRKETTIE